MTNGHNNIQVAGLAFLTGLLVGGLAGVLYAPQSGARTRRQIARLADDARERAGEVAEDTKETMNRMVDHGRRLIHA
jgi:gas vesicle protein